MSSDFILIRKMKQGDDKAFDIFVHKYYKMILNYCNYHCVTNHINGETVCKCQMCGTNIGRCIFILFWREGR